MTDRSSLLDSFKPEQRDLKKNFNIKIWIKRDRRLFNDMKPKPTMKKTDFRLDQCARETHAGKNGLRRRRPYAMQTYRSQIPPIRDGWEAWRIDYGSTLFSLSVFSDWPQVSPLPAARFTPVVLPSLSSLASLPFADSNFSSKQKEPQETKRFPGIFFSSLQVLFKCSWPICSQEIALCFEDINFFHRLTGFSGDCLSHKGLLLFVYDFCSYLAASQRDCLLDFWKTPFEFDSHLAFLYFFPDLESAFIWHANAKNGLRLVKFNGG